MTNRPTRPAEGADEHGATMITLALSMVMLCAVVGLVLDGGSAYANRRQMQNAADAAALAGTRALDQHRAGQGTVAGIRAAALANATSNGADATDVECHLVDLAQADLGTCPTDGSAVLPATAYGVRVTTRSTKGTTFSQAVGITELSARAEATALVQKASSGNSPFMVCGNAPGHDPKILLQDASAPTGWKVNPQAIVAAQEYVLFGNDIRDGGRDCGNPSSSFRGLVDNDEGPYGLPGFWQAEQGNENGPTTALISSGTPCAGAYEDFVDGCVLVLPLCTGGNGQPGNEFVGYCVDLGLFKITDIQMSGNPRIKGVFLGRAVLMSGAGGGAPDVNGARIIQLTA